MLFPFQFLVLILFPFQTQKSRIGQNAIREAFLNSSNSDSDSSKSDRDLFARSDTLVPMRCHVGFWIFLTYYRDDITSHASSRLFELRLVHGFIVLIFHHENWTEFHFLENFIFKCDLLQYFSDMRVRLKYYLVLKWNYNFVLQVIFLKLISFSHSL